MRIRHPFLALVMLLQAASVSQAQPRVLPPSSQPSPYWPYVPRGRFFFCGSFPNGASAFGQGFVPSGGDFFPYGSFEPRVNIRVLGPASSLRVIQPQVDLSGVDLDVAPPPWAKAPDRPRHDVPPAPKPRPEEVVKRVEPVRPPAPPPRPEPQEPQPDPLEEGKRLTVLGLAAFRVQDYGLAARKFNQAIEVDPHGSRTYFLLGQAYYALGKYRDAVQLIGLGLGLEPAWPKSAFRPRFDFYADQPEDRQRHLQLLEDALARQPKNTSYLFLLAYQRWFDDQREEAVRLFRQVRPLVGDPALVDLFLKAN